MMVLWEYGKMTEGELGKKVHLDSGTLAPLLKRLEKAGYIKRNRPEENERQLLLTLTKKGTELEKKAGHVSNTVRGCIPLKEEELLVLKELLNRALGGMHRRDC